ncbi:hypothetical protein CUU66_18860 [Peribacillus deserti]|uniref:Uncharacterized protein n=2 Tax=Peribacillus deserti TaxID=673318 RepID=A0A2N5M1X9_9BACI|nr:hypothetical protein CUU66_18860 [Peribacillus deserti]
MLFSPRDAWLMSRGSQLGAGQSRKAGSGAFLKGTDNERDQWSRHFFNEVTFMEGRDPIKKTC